MNVGSAHGTVKVARAYRFSQYAGPARAEAYETRIRTRVVFSLV